jgi:hypothetical protein
MSTVHLRLSIHICKMPQWYLNWSGRVKTDRATDAAVSPPALGAKVLHHEDVASEHDVGDRPTIDIRIRSNGIVQIYVDKEGEGEGEGKEGEDAGMSLFDNRRHTQSETLKTTLAMHFVKV